MSTNHKSLHCIAIIFVSISAGIVFFNTEDNSVKLTNPGSRYATVEAIVDQDVFYIDNTIYATNNQGEMGTDSVKIGDHYYSSKPPLLSVLTAGVYWYYKTITKKTIRSYTKDVVRFCNRFVIGIPHILLLIYFFRLIRMVAQNDEAVIISMAAMCLTFLGLSYATDMNNHSPSAALLIIGFYYAVRIKKDIQPETKHWYISGICFGLLPAFDIPSLIFTLAISIYLSMHDWKKFLSCFLPSVLLIISVHLILTLVITGSILPIYARSDLFLFEGSYWSEYNVVLSLLKEPKHVYAFHVLVGHHGILTMYPVFILAIIALFKSIKRRSPLYIEAIFTTTTVITLIILYIFKTKDYGGTCVGFRWLIVIMPLLFLFFGVWIDFYLKDHRPQILFWPIIIAVLLIGQFHTLDAVDKLWKKGKWHRYVENSIEDMCCNDH